VVDNAPGGPGTRNLVLGEFPEVRYVLEPAPGLDFARNRALAETSCEIIAFMDDDVVAGPGWIEAIQAAFRGNGRLAICTGKVDPLSLESEGERLFEANGGFGKGSDPIRLPGDRGLLPGGRAIPLIACSIGVGSGCSMALRRDVVLGLGGFDEALDIGPPYPGGGDLDIFWRALDAGHEILYAPSVHSWHEHRKEKESSARQIIEHNRSLIAMLSKAVLHPGNSSRAGVLAFLFWRMAKPGFRILKRMAGRDPLPAGILLRMWHGCFLGLFTYGSARKLAQRRKAEFRA